MNLPGQQAQTITFAAVPYSSSNPRFVPSVIGPNAADFLWGSALEAGLYVTLSFLPHSPGVKSATVVLTDTLTNSIVSTATVTGTGSTDGTFELFSFAGKSLESAGGSSSNGTYIQQSYSRDKGTQLWYLRPNLEGFYAIVNAKNGKVLDDTSYSQSNGTAVQLWDDLGSLNQQWQLQAVDDVHFAVLNRWSGKALDVTGGATSEGALIQQWEFGNRSQQLCTLVPSDPYLLLDVYSGQVVDLAAGSALNGSTIQGWHSNGAKQQQWLFLPQGNGYYSVLSRLTGKSLDLVQGSSNDGAPIQEFEYLGTPNQQWQLSASMVQGMHAFYVRDFLAYAMLNRASGKGPSIPVPHVSVTADGSALQQSGSGSSWALVRLSAYAIQNALSNLVLDVPLGSLADQTNIQQWESNGSLQQQWRLSPIQPGPFTPPPVGGPIVFGSTCPCAIYNVATGKSLESPAGFNGDGVLVDQAEYVGTPTNNGHGAALRGIPSSISS